MPRKDRRFTSRDVARLYCRNLDERQREIALALLFGCDAEMTDNELLAHIIRAVAGYCLTVPLPGMRLVSSMLELLAGAVEIERTQEEIEDYLSISPF